MAVRQVTTATISAQASAAADGDTLVYAAGVYTLPSSVFSKRLIHQASDWAMWKNVTGSTGHNGSGCAVKVIGRQTWATGSRGSVFRGHWLESSNAQSAAGSIKDDGGIGYEDCVLQNRTAAGVGMILYTSGGFGGQVYEEAYFKRCRIHKVGDSEKDHAWYFKDHIVDDASHYFDEDCLVYDISGYAWHFYGNPNGVRSRRTLADRCGKVRAGGATFSGANDSSTGFTGCFYTRNCGIELAQITNSQTSSGTTFGLVESWWGCTVGTGNYVRNSNLNQADGATSTRIKGGGTTLSGVSLSGNVNVDPDYADPLNGDFTIGNPAAEGYGPLSIQPDGPAPPPSVPPDSVAGLQATVGITSQRVTLNWTNPGGTWDAVVIRRATGAYPASAFVGTSVYDGTGTTVNDNTVNNGTAYYYSAFVRRGEFFSAPAQVTATPSAPVVGGPNIAGKTTPGTAGYKGMTPDIKRGWLVPFGPNKKIVLFKAHLRGNGAGTAFQDLRAVAYDATSGVGPNMPLMVQSAPQGVADNVNDLAYNFLILADYVLPAAGGQMVIGLLSGQRVGTRTPSTAEVQYSYDVQAGALHVASDAFVDGASSTYGAITLDTALGTMWAVLEDVEDPVEEPPNPVTNFTATAGDGRLTLAWTVPVTPYDEFMVRRSSTTYPTDEEDGTLAYQGTATGFIDQPLPNGTQQFYKAFAVRDGLYSTGVQATGTPASGTPDPDPDPDPPPPPPSQGLLASIDQSLVYLDAYITTANTALTASASTASGDDDDLAVSNLQLAGRCREEVTRARALLFRMAG